jgi:hypothetical protein
VGTLRRQETLPRSQFALRDKKAMKWRYAADRRFSSDITE